MTTNYFQGKWAILYTGNNNYLSGDENGIAATSSTITPSATFILYSPILYPMFGFEGYVQLQGNMQYIAVGNCVADGENGFPGQCQLVASAPDPSSALTLVWLLPPPPQMGFVNATYGGTVPVGQGIGVVTWSGQCYWGFYTIWPDGPYGETETIIITPGLYAIGSSQSWPNTDLSFVDLTGQDFSGGYQFQGSDFQQAVLDQVNLSGANVSGVNFSGASLAGTNFTGATLSSANFTSCDLTTIVYDNTTVAASTQSAPGSFNSAQLPFTLINRNWEWLDLRNSTVTGIPSPLSTSANVLQASGAKLSGMNQSFTGMTLENAVLDNSLLDGLDLSNADLTSASLIDASLHGTNLSGTSLVGANMSGAQLGALAQLFTLPLSVEPALNAGQVSALSSYFSQNGITFSSTATLDTLAAGRVWQLNDAGNNVVYTIRLDTPTAQTFTVYESTAAASLVNAYMPNAVLTGVNLYGVLANNIQFYGSGALIDGSAILEDAQLNGSNLSNVNFTQAQLMGTNLSGSYLFNASFNAANLTPSANGIAADLSDSNLQGADFTDAQLSGANLANAAVAIDVPTKANPNQGGVYLFSLPYTDDSNTVQQYIAELSAAALTHFSFNPNGDAPTLGKYVTALETNNLATLQVAFLEQSPPITLSNNAQINTIESSSVWQIVDMQNSYTLWTDVDESGDTELYAASSLTLTQAAFQQNGITLRWQASAAIDTPDQQWLLDNDSENPNNFSTGYVSFVLMVNGSVLDVYGTALRIIRLGDNNQQEYDTETCNVTVLSVTNMSGSTICPNGATLTANQTLTGETWDQRWLRASALPKPPSCVPTDFNWCPATSASSDAQRASGHTATKGRQYMGPFTFIGVWAFSVPESNWLQPNGSNYVLWEFGQGNPQDPANAYNVYSTSTSGEYIFQSQLNGMYLGIPVALGLVCASVADPAQSQPLIPTPLQDVTVLYLPDKVHFLGERSDEEGYDWETDLGGNYVYNDGGLQPTIWNFSDLLAGKGTSGFTLNYANLTGYVFTAGSNFTEINFSGAILDGATFDQCNLTRANFTNCSLKEASFRNAIIVETIFNQADLNGAKFRGVELTNLKGTGAVLDAADFTEATFTTPVIPGASLDQTILSNATLDGGDLSNCDLRTVIADGATLVSAQLQPLVLNGAKLSFPLIKYDWQWVDLRNATMDQMPQVLSSASNPLNATGAKLSDLNQNNLRGLTLEHAVFDYSVLDKLDLSSADLAGASLIQASLHGATLTEVKLPDANLTGAQFGSLGHLFTLSTSFETDLNAGPNVDAALTAQFTQNGITLSSTASLETLAAGRVWELNDAGNHVIYTIRLETQSDAAQVLTVYAPAAPASLVNAYMPNAVLTGANLFGVLANGIHFYGSKAAIDGSAILEEAQLNGSNLSHLNLTQAQLLGTNLSGSYIFNAKFNKANLTPSATGVPANLSDANLQGADFTDAQLFGANLANAAVAINVPTKANPNQGGVYLFSLPYAGDSNAVQQYIAELNAAATEFSLNPNGDAPTLQKYVTALETNDLGTLKVPFLMHHITLSNSAQIQTIDVGDVWQIVDGQNSYTLWTDIDENGNTQLYAAPSLTNTRAAFQQNNFTLRWQTSAAIDTVGRQWLLDNDSENPKNFSLGYVRFVLVLDGGVLDVYGTALRIERLGDNNQLQIDTETCTVTTLTLANMNSDTVCPNGAKLSTNQNTAGVQWDTKWLRASSPPKPPTCVPTDYSWCPPSQQKAEHRN